MHALLAALAVVIFWCAPTTAQAMSEDEYWKRFTALFHEFLEMKRDGVFMDYDMIEALKKSGFTLPNRIRGSHPPGGHFGRPPGKTWLKRMQALREVEVEGHRNHLTVCTPIPKLYTDRSDSVCAFELFDLYSFSGKHIDLDRIAARFHLALICRASPAACIPSVRKETAVATKVNHRVPAQCFQKLSWKAINCSTPWVKMLGSTRHKTAWHCRDTGKSCFVERRGREEGCGCSGSLPRGFSVPAR